MSQTINMSELLFGGFLLAAESFWWLPVVVVFSAILKIAGLKASWANG